VANAYDGLLRGHGLPSFGQAAELVVLSAAIGARATAPTPGARRERPATPGSSPTSYGYRRIHALLKRRGVACNPKTVWRVLRLQGWLSTSRRRIIRSRRRHEGWLHVSEPNRRGVSHDQYPSVGTVLE
jgi:HTH-like domain